MKNLTEKIAYLTKAGFTIDEFALIEGLFFGVDKKGARYMTLHKDKMVFTVVGSRPIIIEGWDDLSIEAFTMLCEKSLGITPIHPDHQLDFIDGAIS